MSSACRGPSAWSKRSRARSPFAFTRSSAPTFVSVIPETRRARCESQRGSPKVLPAKRVVSAVGVRPGPTGARFTVEGDVVTIILDGGSLTVEKLVRIAREGENDDGVEARPVARRLAGAAVDHELVRCFRDFGVEVVHEHAQGGFLLPALASDRGSTGSADYPCAGQSAATLCLSMCRHRFSFASSRAAAGDHSVGAP